MSSGRSSRQAAVKATEAMHQATGRGERKTQAAPKRKGSRAEPKAPPAKAKRGKQEKPTAEKRNGGKKETEEKNDRAEVDGGKKEKASPAPELKDGKATPPAEEITETAVRKSEEREDVMPSNILEKGIIYFFFRPRVSVDEPEGIDDVARSFLVLRPLPHETKLGEGPIGDEENCRLLLLPKKKLPTSSRERYTGFVEKSGVSVKTLKESFKGEEYQTKTRGTQQVEPATPAAEGVYAITSTTRTSHLAYIITIPSELNEVQGDFGLKNRGSFVVTTKNPKFPGPSNARLPRPPEFPQEIMEELRDLRWAPLQPKFLDYPNAQFLMIGEAQEELGKGGMTEQKGPGKEEAGEELENLEHENEVRAYPLRGNDTVFDDLGMNMDAYPKVATTWE